MAKRTLRTCVTLSLPENARHRFEKPCLCHKRQAKMIAHFPPDGQRCWGAANSSKGRRTTGVRPLSKPLVFDRPMQSEMRDAEIEFLRRVIPPWQTAFALRTALDMGCGVGYFSATLRDLGFQTSAADGRAENISEARTRHTDIDFHVADVEDPALSALGVFDLVLCLGLLYHLENPLRAFRNLRALTGKLLLLESMVLPDDEPYLIVMDEPGGEDQSMAAVSCYPSEGAIVKMAFRAGFPHVYRFRELPDHENYRPGIGRTRARTLIAASTKPLNSPLIEVAVEPRYSSDLWTTDPTGITKTLRKLRRTLKHAGKRKRS
jgi:SAM-dependent methyltransferase